MSKKFDVKVVDTIEPRDYSDLSKKERSDFWQPLYTIVAEYITNKEILINQHDLNTVLLSILFGTSEAFHIDFQANFNDLQSLMLHELQIFLAGDNNE